ncbi:MAG: DUF6252 family protein [Ignavibacterium sp.]|nr:DUF6252 family protein [Ignavibacterium sp.]
MIYKFFSKTILFVVALSLLTLSGCKKEENPASSGDDGGPTQTGAGTMSCKIDGQNWSSTSYPGAPGAYAIVLSLGNNVRVSIIGNNISLNPSTITIEINEIPGPGEYKLGEMGVGGAVGFGNYSDQTGEYQTTASSEYSGKINIIKLDRANKIISGTFEFNAKKSNSTQKKVITAGKFDVKWN